MKVSELKKGFYQFGNKGNVWSNTTHIDSVGRSATLCGVPMLSRNWAEILEHPEIGCKECLTIYNELVSEQLEIN